MERQNLLMVQLSLEMQELERLAPSWREALVWRLEAETRLSSSGPSLELVWQPLASMRTSVGTAYCLGAGRQNRKLGRQAVH